MTQLEIKSSATLLESYYFRLLIAASRIHILRCRQYWVDVLIWILSIWLTIGIQAFFIFVLFNASNQNFFGYSLNDLIVFFAMALLATGLAQIVVHGVVLHLANSVWTGQFDYWLVHPPNIFFRMIIEDLGIAWFWPHIVAGVYLLYTHLSVSQFIVGISCSLLAAIMEMCWILCFCVPAIKWSRWNPNEGLWEYLENARSVPVLRMNNKFLWLISGGVIQYSLAIEVMTGRLQLIHFFMIVLMVAIVTIIFQRSLINSYTSASS